MEKKEYTLVTKENKKYFQRDFSAWLDKRYPNVNGSDIIAYNVMYSISQGCEININDLILKKVNIDQYEDEYIKRFEGLGRKNARGHAHIQRECAKYFIEFVEEEFYPIS